MLTRKLRRKTVRKFHGNHPSKLAGLSLDVYSNELQFAYSLDSYLLSSYKGNTIEVLEDDLGTTQEFKPSPTMQAEILAFVGENNGYIVGIYDQTTGTKTVVSTSTQQILLVNAGVWVNFTNKYSLEIPSKTLLTVSGIAACNRIKNLLCVNYIGFKGEKTITNYNNDYVYPLNINAGILNISLLYFTERFWYLVGGISSTALNPNTSIGSGISYLFSTVMKTGRVELADLSTRFIGNTKDIPSFTLYLSLNNCSNAVGKFIDLPRVTTELDMYNVQISDNVIDCPRVTEIFTATLANNVYGNMIDVPRAFVSCHLYGATAMVGSFADLVASIAHRHRNLVNVTGVLPLLPTTNYIDVAGTGMTASDTDTLLINLAAITTVTSGGQLWIKNNRTVASDAAIAFLTGKFTIIII